MFKRGLISVLCVGLLVGMSAPAFAQEPFFKGKTVRIIVGFSPGGEYDTYARLVGRHMGKHLPGSPTVVVDNMPGADSLISANHLYAGYALDNWQQLEQDIRQRILSKEAIPIEQTRYGEYFEIRASLSGPNRLALNVRTVHPLTESGAFRSEPASI